MRKWFLQVFVLIAIYTQAQVDTLPVTFENTKALLTSPPHAGRKWLIGAGTAAAYGGSFIFLNEAWYKNYEREAFHFYNDSGEWQQVDKVGHVWTTYQTSRLTMQMWKWAGVNEKKAILYGTGSSLLYMLSIEYLDGRSAEWGWSWADAGANTLGAGLFATQQLAWSDQRIQVKFSSHNKKYHGDLKTRADQLYGSSFHGRLLKDYNAQTYWLSTNMKWLFPQSSLPEWLHIAIGYGAENMFGGYENIGMDEYGNTIFDRRDLKRYRQWYLSPDIDLTKIKTNSKFLKAAFGVFNVLKMPAPAIEYSNGRFQLHAISF